MLDITNTVLAATPKPAAAAGAKPATPAANPKAADKPAAAPAAAPATAPAGTSADAFAPAPPAKRDIEEEDPDFAEDDD